MSFEVAVSFRRLTRRVPCGAPSDKVRQKNRHVIFKGAVSLQLPCHGPLAIVLFIRAVVSIVPIMLSFPVQNWETAVNSTKKSGLQPGSRFGRSASLIVPRVYLSGYSTASDAEELSRLGITHVVSVLEHAPNIPDSIAAKNKLHVCVADQPEEYILAHFEETTEFIRSALAESKKNNVLVGIADCICM